MRVTWTTASATLWAACLSACAAAPPSTEIRVERPAIPPALLACAPSPPVPDPPVTRRDLARWIVDLHAAGADCRDTLAAVARLLADRPATGPGP